MTRKTLFLMVGGGLCLALVVAAIFLLRSRNVDSVEPLAATSPAKTSQPIQPSGGGLTKEEQATKDEVGRLEQTLPKDISQTWSPEFRKAMEARHGTAASYATSTVTP